jgi:hypothetical protein
MSDSPAGTADPQGPQEPSPDSAPPSRPPKRRRRRRRVLLLCLAAVLVLAMGVLIDGYRQVHAIGSRLGNAFRLLQAARSELLLGNVEAGGTVDAALAAVAGLQADLMGADPTLRLMGGMPVLRRPVDAVRLGVAAATEAGRALSVARGVVAELSGSQGAGGGLLQDGRVNIGLISSIAPRIQAGLVDLRAAARDLQAIPHLPFLGFVGDAKAAALADAAESIRVAERAASAINLLPSFFGADGPRTYLMAFENNADLRATGGALLAYGLIRIDDGRILLIQGGGVTKLDHNRPIPVPIPQPIRWYLRVTHRPDFIDNGPNYTPDFPVVAATWAKQAEKATGVHVDGVIALDSQAVAYALQGQPPLRIPAYPEPITSRNVADVTENLQYLLPTASQNALPGQLIGAAFGALTNPRDVVAMARNLATALTENRVQLWSSDSNQEALLAKLGWNGALRPVPWDYLLLVREKRNAGKVDYYTSEQIAYRVKLLRSGDADVTFGVLLDNSTPAGLPNPIVGSWVPYGLNVQMLNLYVPERARFVSVDPATPIDFRTRPRSFRQHIESGRFRVFTKIVQTSPGQPSFLQIRYVLPDVVMRTAQGLVYQLTMQAQPLVRPGNITVTLELPRGAEVTAADPGWRVKGRVATLGYLLTREITTSLTYSLP